MFFDSVRSLRAQGAELTSRAAVAVGDRQALLRMHGEGRLENEIHYLRGGLLSIAVRVNRVDMVSQLLDLGFDPDESTIADDGSRSWGMPLWFAALCGRTEIASVLLAQGADVNAIVCGCGDPLGNAMGNGDQDMQDLLLAHGGRVTVEHVGLGRDKETAQAILEGTVTAGSLNVHHPTREQLVEQLLWAAACGGEPEIVRWCLPRIRRELKDPWWHSILMQPLRVWNHAPGQGMKNLDRSTYPLCLDLILRHGVHPDAGPDSGATQLHTLATVEEMTKQERITFATLLLNAGAALHRRDAVLLSTPLGWACRWGRPELVHLYLQRGADATEADAEPWATPLAWATKVGHTSIADLLRRACTASTLPPRANRT